MEFTNNINNLKDFSPDGLRRVCSGRQLFVNAGATAQVLASYDSLVNGSRAATVPELFRLDASPTGCLEQICDGFGAWTNGWARTWIPRPVFFFLARNKTALVGKTVPSLFDWGSNLATAKGWPNLGCKSLLQFAGAVRRSSRPCSPRCRPRSSDCQLQ